ncbi:MAG: tyrosine-type recombinase/integrase [Nitrososphaera sp.]|nr:tyrosine-type recombinase/integrase [Nitrososphaera sp.]
MKFRVYKRGGSPYYQLDVSIELPDGKRRRVRESLDVKDYATAKMKGKIRARELQQSPDEETITIAEFKEEYLIYCKDNKGREQFLNERSILKRLVEHFPSMLMRNLNSRLADQFITSLRKPKLEHGKEVQLSSASVNSYIRFFRSIFNTAIRWNYITTNPFVGAKHLPVQMEPPRILSIREISSIMTTTQHHLPHLVPVWEFCLGTGLRRSELIRLKPEDFDFERSIIIVRGKRKKLRWVPMLPQARKIALQRAELQKPFPFTGEYLTKKYMRMARKANVSNTSLHDLRRAYGSYLIYRGISRDVVMKLLGHDDFNTTDTFYFGISDDVIRQINSLAPPGN